MEKQKSSWESVTGTHFDPISPKRTLSNSSSSIATAVTHDSRSTTDNSAHRETHLQAESDDTVMPRKKKSKLSDEEKQVIDQP